MNVKRFLFAVGFLFYSLPSFSQGIYATSWADASLSLADVGVYGYPGAGCSGSAEWSAFNGQWGSGVTVVQSAPLVDGMSYPWNWGFTVYFSDPYTGSCQSYSISFSWTLDLGFRTTYFQHPLLSHPDNDGICYYDQLACTNNIEPTCQTAPLYPLPMYCTGQCLTCPGYGIQPYWYMRWNQSASCTPLLPLSQNGPGMCT